MRTNLARGDAGSTAGLVCAQLPLALQLCELRLLCKDLITAVLHTAVSPGPCRGSLLRYGGVWVGSEGAGSVGAVGDARGWSFGWESAWFAVGEGPKLAKGWGLRRWGIPTTNSSSLDVQRCKTGGVSSRCFVRQHHEFPFQDSRDATGLAGAAAARKATGGFNIGYRCNYTTGVCLIT